jgi:serine/threonine-protein kinase
MDRIQHEPYREQDSFELVESPPPDWHGLKPAVGDRVGAYRLTSCLKDGDRGVVFRGLHEASRRNVILKFPVPETVWNGIASASMEALILSSLRHSSVNRLLETGRDKDRIFLVLEPISGETLDDRLQRGEALAPMEAARLLRASAVSLASVHSRGILHGDVKPGNLMLTREGSVRLIDFGLARFSGVAGEPFGEGVIVGSPYYISPEQALGLPLDERSDIYSLGATFYHVLSGRPPFDGPDPATVAGKHLQGNPPPPVHLNPEIPEGLSRIVEQMMSRNPGDRYRSMNEVVRAVAAWESGHRQSAA